MTMVEELRLSQADTARARLQDNQLRLENLGTIHQVPTFYIFLQTCCLMTIDVGPKKKEFEKKKKKKAPRVKVHGPTTKYFPTKCVPPSSVRQF